MAIAHARRNCGRRQSGQLAHASRIRVGKPRRLLSSWPMWSFEHPMFLTLAAVVAVIVLAYGGFYLFVNKFPGHRGAGQVVTVTRTIAVCIVFSVGLNQLWGARRDRDQRVWTARSQHLQRLQILLRAESESLTGMAQALREGRYFALVADDARKAVWRDDTLTTDIERHFPEYFRERERLIRTILEHDSKLGHIRQIVSATLRLTEATEFYRSDLVPALVKKCGGAAPGVSFNHIADNSAFRRMGGRSSGVRNPDQIMPMRDAFRTYEQYRCTSDLARMCQSLFDRAADLADAALVASEAARRYAEETVLHGSCTYAPAE